ncbi:MAG: ankyrin repeat domain-containing protein [Planctomycetes bacterium]|nr:ankyrin repeat domain-containing protein [Planctomycetota bacterium]MBL7142789.1 ankyrin repeat domain-containing protein [Phycisphaerae bacterium]
MISELFSAELFLWSCLWQSTIFIAAGLLGSFILRHRSARAHQVLLLAIIAAVAVPVISILVKHYELGMFEAEPIAIQSQPEDQIIYEATGITSIENIEHKPGTVEKDLTSVITTPESTKLPLRSFVLYGWLAASLILAFRLAVTFILGVRLLGRAMPLDCNRIEQAVHLAKAKLRINKDVSFYSSRGVQSPVIWCWKRRPILLLPSAAGLSENRIDWAGVLCHELAHYKRRDHISGLSAELLVCIMPWHPLLWWAKSRLISLSEQACDDWVVATGQPCTDYAESLLDLTPGGQMAFVPAVVSSKKGLAGRVQRILKNNCPNPRTGAVWALTVTIVAVCLTMVVACAQTRPAKQETTTEHEAKPTKSLHQAVADGDIEQVKLLIAKGADVNAKDKRGYAPQAPGQTPLFHAASGGHKEIAILLIAHGADVNAKMADHSWTPLLDAACAGHAQVVKVLLENGAKVDVGDNYGYTPLYYAIWIDDEEAVRMLIAAGADVNRRINEKDEYNAFFEAVWQGHKGIVKAFIDAGANVNYKDDSGRTPLHHALQGTNADVAKQFIGARVKIPAFHNAVLEGDLAKVTQLVESGMDVNTKDEFGWTPSYWALSAGQKKVFAYLLSQGANVTAKANDGRTLLHQASKAGFTEIVKQLIAKGVEVDAKPDSGNTPLKIAAGADHEEIVKLLIANGAVVNVTAKNGTHPLGDAAVNGHEKIVRLLLASGAKVNLQPEDKLMCGTALHAAARGGHIAIFDLFIANGADVNAVYKNGTPLHLAAGAKGSVKDNRSAEIVEKLLALGADVNAKSPSRDRTPLHEAVDKGRYKTARLLIAAGANVNATDKKGNTPLSEAPVNSEIFELLRKHGARKN